MSSIKYPLIGGRVARATILDSCGVPAWGDFAQVTSDGIVTIGVTANYDDGEEITVTNFAGKRCISRAAEPELINLSVDVTFCQVDPDYYTVVTGFPKVLDPASGDTIGFKVNRGVRPSDVDWALEVWSAASTGSACNDDGETPYGYLLWPYLTGGRVGDYSLENGAVTFSVTGALTQDNPGWAEGPYNVMYDADGDPDVLQDPVEDLDHQVVFRTFLPPPEASIGLIPLDDPDGSAATSATAGTPGTWDGVRPYDLADLQASAIVSPSGVTSWTSGQYVILGDGSLAHWAGSGATPKWVAGAKP